MDVLAALENLEEAEREKKANDREKKTNAASGKKGKKGKGLSAAERNAQKNAQKNANAGQNSRSRSQASHRSTGALSADKATENWRNALNASASNGDLTPAPRTPSIGGESARRISFAEPSRPEGNKLWIATKTDSPASGYPFDARLLKYNVSEEEWTHFNKDLLEASAVPGPSWMWTFRKKKVMERIKRDLQYDGDVKKVFKKWNRIFKVQRFQAWLELPGEKSAPLEGNDLNEKVEVKKFRVVISPNNERPPSVYSRTNSLTRSVTGEGVQAIKSRADTEAEEKRIGELLFDEDNGDPGAS